jgi:hypothetical protein
VKRVLIVFLLVIAVGAAAGLIWTLVTPPQETRTIPFPETLAREYGNKTLTLVAPKSLRLGEAGQVILLVRATDGENSSETSQAENQYGFQSRLDLPAIRVLPSGLQSSPYDPSSGADFSWMVTPLADGVFEGTLKVYVSQGQSLPPGESGELIFAIPIAVKVQRVLGMPLDVTRALMIFVLVLLGFPMLVLFNTRR